MDCRHSTVVGTALRRIYARKSYRPYAFYGIGYWCPDCNYVKLDEDRIQPRASIQVPMKDREEIKTKIRELNKSLEKDPYETEDHSFRRGLYWVLSTIEVVE
jgi:hypothetical protein